MSNKDILNIDTKIRDQFLKEYEKLPELHEKLKEISKSLESKTLSCRLRKNAVQEQERISEYIDRLEKRSEFNFYLANTIDLIEQYKKILKTPIKMNFMGKPVKENKTKKTIVRKYLDIARKYTTIDKTQSTNTDNIVCPECKNKRDFDVIDKNTYICMVCFTQQTVIRHNSSYTDIDRVNISMKYMYDRKIHFRDCIKQYQGKQNCTINPMVYKDLEEQFDRHHLLVKNDSTVNRFQNITKNHVLMFLKELGYANHYENVHLIHYTITGIKPDDISHLEDQLLEDFDLLTELYDNKFKHINRKNFINTQYVLYQLLLRHKHPCKKEEFIILKTIDRKLFHDEICQSLFTQLGWNSTPFY
tara:strand:+ start:3556 stop:4635 length:1080 start_codon:yes stop_codon:yes gene_type:complete